MDETVLYRIDPQKSLFTVHPFATGVASAGMSHGLSIAIRDFIGELRFIPGTLQKASIHLKIKSNSLTVTDEMKDDDRQEVERTMKDLILRTAEHPSIEFVSSLITPQKTAENHYKVEVAGNLSLLGSACPQSFEAVVVAGASSLRANGQFAARQTDYGIPSVTAMGGMIKIRDEVKFHFYIVAEKVT